MVLVLRAGTGQEGTGTGPEGSSIGPEGLYKCYFNFSPVDAQ